MTAGTGPVRIRIEPRARRRIGDLAAAAGASEACGFLLGGGTSASPTVSAVSAARNGIEGAAARRAFRIGPADLFAAERAATASGLSVVGVFHSHPSGGALPSPVDLAHAALWPGWIFVVAPLGGAPWTGWTADGEAVALC